MALLFRSTSNTLSSLEQTLSFRRDKTPPPSSPSPSPSPSSSPSPSLPPPTSSLQSPFLPPSSTLSPSDLRATSYDILLSATRSSSSKPLPPSTSSSNTAVTAPSAASSLSSSVDLSKAASRVKKALGLRASASSLGLRREKSGVSDNGNGGSGSTKAALTVGELMRVQMRVSEVYDSRIRRAMLRVAASQLGKRIDSLVLPLELLQQLKPSDFTNQQEYEEWQKRNLRILEAGLLLHPYQPLGKADDAAQRLRKIIRGAMERPLETGKHSESMQVLRSAVVALASRSADGMDCCHWADGSPLNLCLYQMLLEACFDVNYDSIIIEEIDEVMELIKKTWPILGINQMLHNLCFSWVLFDRFVATGQVDNDLLSSIDGQLEEVAKDAKTTKDPVYSKFLSATLTSILGWVERRLLAYHDTFDNVNVSTMPNIVSIGITAAKTLVEDISHEYRRKRKGEVDVARSRIDTYIRSSLRTAFAQRMEKADSSRRASKNQPNPLPILAILAKDVGELAAHEKKVFSPILKRWHPLAAGVAVATLHACFGNELKQFIAGITELTPDAVQILRAADKLEQDLVQTAVEDSVDSEDGGKAIIREMPPYEAEAAIAHLVKVWTKTRLDRMKERVDSSIQQEVWNPRASQEGLAASAVDALRTIDDTLDAFFQLPITMHPALLPDLVVGLDRCLQYYVSKAKAGCGSRNTFLPTMPALTRCPIESKLGVFKKKDKSLNSQKRNSQVAANGESAFGVPQLCVRINTLQRFRTELEVVEKRIITHLRNCKSAREEDFSNGAGKKFELTPAACVEAIHQLSEALGYKLVFNDLSHVMWDGLYVGDASSSRIESFLQELERNLLMISDTINERIRTRIITDIMKASFDGFLLVLLAGGPSRAFSRQDSQIIEEDFKALKDLFWANGDGLPSDLINKYSSTAREVLPLFRADSDSLIECFKRLTFETYGSSAKSRFPLPPTSGHWSSTEPNTLLRVLCYRNDEAATKYLKKTYNLPKKL